MADAGQDQAHSLANALVAAADRMRELYTTVGLRPYRVFLVKGFWAGDRKGHGDLLVTSRRELEPRPRVRDLGTLNLQIRSTGRVEDGDVFVDQISARYVEEELTGRSPDMADPSLPRTSRREVDFWWEIEEARPGCPEPLVRAFSPRALPALRRDEFQWTITLARRELPPRRMA